MVGDVCKLLSFLPGQAKEHAEELEITLITLVSLHSEHPDFLSFTKLFFSTISFLFLCLFDFIRQFAWFSMEKTDKNLTFIYL